MRRRRNPITHATALQAAEWIERLKSPDNRTGREFLDWLRQSPSNVREFMLAKSLDEALRGIDSQHRIDIKQLRRAVQSNVIPLPAAGVRVPALHHERRPGRWALPLWASSLAVAILIVACLLVPRGPSNEAVVVTEVSDQTPNVMEFADGSLIEIEETPRLSVVLSQTRRTAVFNGRQATFDLAYDETKPFFVRLSGLTIVTSGAKFKVSRREQETQVWVSESDRQGRLDIRPDGSDQSYLLLAGNGVSFFRGDDGTIVATRLESVQHDHVAVLTH